MSNKNPKLQECIEFYESHVRHFCPELRDTFYQWQANPCYDFALLLQAHLDHLLGRVIKALEDVEVIHAHE
jgi:hypothetical protein